MKTTFSDAKATQSKSVCLYAVFTFEKENLNQKREKFMPHILMFYEAVPYLYTICGECWRRARTTTTLTYLPETRAYQISIAEQWRWFIWFSPERKKKKKKLSQVFGRAQRHVAFCRPFLVRITSHFQSQISPLHCDCLPSPSVGFSLSLSVSCVSPVCPGSCLSLCIFIVSDCLLLDFACPLCSLFNDLDWCYCFLPAVSALDSKPPFFLMFLAPAPTHTFYIDSVYNQEAQ